jgi:predicted MFS family arabinose efflux permease
VRRVQLLKSLMREAAEDSKLGMMLGVLGSVERGVGVAAPLLGGPCYDYVGPAAPAVLAAVSALAGVALTTLIGEPAKRKAD